MNRPLDLTRLWRETIGDTRALLPLVWPVAAAFVLLPNVLIDRFGPPLPKTPAEMTPQLVLILLVVPGLIALVAQAVVIRLALDRRRGGGQPSVGEALGAALRLWPLLVAVQGLAALAIVPALLLLILPGLYVAGRLLPAVPLALDGAGPVAAVERGWALSQGNGWRAIGFLLLLFGWFIVVSAAVGAVGAGVAAALASAGAKGVGALLASTLDGAVAAVFAVVSAVATATVYRMLGEP